MIGKIIEFCANNRLLVILLYLALVVYSFLTMRDVPLDAIPDLSDTQVIVYTKWDRSPDILEDQVTYPIVSALLGAPKVKAIRGLSDFGFSYVYVIFEDGTDIYWARSRVVEYLSRLQGTFPQGVNPSLGPDASGVGWVFQYSLVDRSGRHDLQELRSYQDWTLKYALQSVPGVAEVASIGGFQKQYQVTVDPDILHNFNLSIKDISDAVQRSSDEVGGRLVEWTGREYMVRGRGYVKSVADLEQTVVRAGDEGTPVLLRDVATIQLGPQIRRGVADLNGEGDAVGGIVVMRHGENAMKVIERVKNRLGDLKASLPEGVEVVTTYDRSELIERSISNLKGELLIEMIIVSLVILFFLWHIPSAFVPIVTIPASVVICFVPLYLTGTTSNIMSLAGIAISVGVLVDGAIVEVENVYKKLELWHEQGRKEDYRRVIIDAIIEVAPSVFFSLLVIAVSFLPVFVLLDQEGRLFRPLAFTKTFVMLVAAGLAVTLDPAIRLSFARMTPFVFGPRPLSGLANLLLVGKYYPEETHPVSKVLFKLYERPCRWVLRNPVKVIAASVLIMAATVPVAFRLGGEFMPPLNEGVILYMPTTMPGISVTEAHRLLQTQDRILRSFPEVVSVSGKAGRADTSTDPAPFSMMETTVVLKPQSEWRTKDRWYSGWAPDWAKGLFLHVWPDRISWEELIAEMDRELKIPGSVNAWTMPIKGRIDMLSTGVRTPIGIKVLGDDLAVIQDLGEKIEAAVRPLRGTRSVYAERVSGGYFVDIVPRREMLARYGLSVDDLQQVVMLAIGGETVASTVEKRERYTISVRYPKDLRENMDQLAKVYVTTAKGAQIPMGELAELKLVNGPAMIRDENGMLAGYVYVDIEGRDIASYVAEAKKVVAEKVKRPAGYDVVWSGQYENMVRVSQRLWGWTKVPGIPEELPLFGVVQLTIGLIFLLLFLNTKSAFKAALVMLAVPFSLVGAIWFLYLLGYNLSIAVWVGMIALMGLDAETGVFMLLFLDLSYAEAKKSGKLKTIGDLHDAIVHGAVKRIRPKMMTVAAASIGLLPIMWSMGAGSDLMKRIAAPMIGGLTTSFLMELLVYPAIYLLWKKSSSR